MRRGGAGLIAALLALAGCKATDPKAADKKEPAGTPVAKAKGKTPPWLDAGGDGIPEADSWAHPKGPGFDVASEVKGVLAGRVLDPAGRGAKNVYVRIEPADAPPGTEKAAAVGILTDVNGYFMAKGLKPGQTYNLTAEAQLDGKPIYGVMQARTPNPTLVVSLRDDLTVPPALPGPASPGGPPTAGTPAPPPVPSGEVLPPPAAGDLIPPMGLTPSGGPVGRPADGGWSPGGAAATRPLPPTLPTPGGPPAVTPPTPTPPPGLPAPAPKPENVAGGPADPWKPPAANIPGPPVPALPPAVPPLPTPPKDDPKPAGKPMSRVKPGANFTLIDTLERPWDFASARSGSLVLVEFMTTTCGPCKKFLPVLIDLQARYGAAGLQLVGVVCDEAPLKARIELATRYHRENGLNYALLVEPGPEPGAVRDRFLVQNYPTAVLLDGVGNIVWRGHPGIERAALEAAVMRHLGK